MGLLCTLGADRILTFESLAAGAKGYYAVVVFQQIASIGNNISIQIVAGLSMKVRANLGLVSVDL